MMINPSDRPEFEVCSCEHWRCEHKTDPGDITGFVHRGPCEWCGCLKFESHPTKKLRRDIIAVHWFNFSRSIGVVVIEDEVWGRRAYVGRGFGSCEADYINSIRDSGSQLNVEYMKKIIRVLEGGRT